MFSKLKEIVHCGVILVTLLAKASLWADPEGSFRVLSARLELCHSSPSRLRGPGLSLPSLGWPTDFYPCPPPGRQRRRYNAKHTPTARCLWKHCGTHPFSPLHSLSCNQCSVFPLSVPIQNTPAPSHPSQFFPSFSTLVEVARQQRKTSLTHTPHDASEGFPDVLVYIMECAGRRETDAEALWSFFCYADLRSSPALLHNDIITKS